VQKVETVDSVAEVEAAVQLTEQEPPQAQEALVESD
jgi:hypothetical protein